MNKWSKNELVRALAIYAGMSTDEKLHVPTELIERLMIVLPGRTYASVEMRLKNFISLDQELLDLGFKGLANTGGGLVELWAEFSDENTSLDVNKLLKFCALNF
jgi:hypothetical protein